MPLDAHELGRAMIAAARAELRAAAPAAAGVEFAFAQLATALVRIETLAAEARLTPRQAALLLDSQRDAVRTVLLTAEGMTAVAAERALSAALAVVRVAVNAALGRPLL